MQEDRSDEHPTGDEVGNTLGGKGPAGAGHLGTARFGGEHGLVRGEGVAIGHVGVGDGAAVLHEGGAQVSGSPGPVEALLSHAEANGGEEIVRAQKGKEREEKSIEINSR